MRQRDFERSIGDKMMPHVEQGARCPSIMGWPEDDVSKWVASHRDETKNVICRSSEGKNVGFCGSNRSRTQAKPIETKDAEMSHAGGRKTKIGAKAGTRTKTARKSVAT
jgi:hypothetical protein